MTSTTLCVSSQLQEGRGAWGRARPLARRLGSREFGSACAGLGDKVITSTFVAPRDLRILFVAAVDFLVNLVHTYVVAMLSFHTVFSEFGHVFLWR